MDVELSIDRLVLDGLDFDNGAARAVADALETELARRLAAQRDSGGGDVRLHPGTTARLTADPVALAAGMEPVIMGRQLGAAVFGGLAHG